MRGSSKPSRGSGRLARRFLDRGAGLDLPDDLEFLAEGVVVDRSELNDVLRLPVGRRPVRRWKSRRTDVEDRPAPVPHADELSLLRSRDCQRLSALKST